MMYDELVKRLRANADYMDNNGITLYAVAPFYRECADAIEELMRQLAEYKKFDGFLMAHGMFGPVEWTPAEILKEES